MTTRTEVEKLKASKIKYGQIFRIRKEIIYDRSKSIQYHAHAAISWKANSLQTLTHAGNKPI